MAGPSSWLGSLLSLAAFLAARWAAAGLAAPALFALLVACSYIWFFVLRVPDLRGIEPDGSAAVVCEKAPEPRRADDGADDDLRAPDGDAKSAAAHTSASAAEGAQRLLSRAGGDAAAQPLARTAAEGVATAEAPSGAAATSAAAGAADASSCAPVADAAPSDTARVATAASGADMEPSCDAMPSADAAPGCGGAASSAAQAPSVEAAGGAADADTSPPAGEGDAASSTAVGPTEDAASSLDALAATEAAREAAEPAAAEREEHGDQPDGSESSGDEDGEKDEEEDNCDVDPERAQELRVQGNEFFKAGKVHDAREAYSEAIYLTPIVDKKGRAVLYGNRAACMQKLSRWDDVVSDCKLAVELDPGYVKAWMRRSTAYEALEKWHDSLEDLKKAIELDPSIKSREYKRQAMLEARSQQQFEKDKDEMMGKLKDLGNTILGKFGMSTDNFKLEQDPNTGSYSIKYQN